MHLTIIVGMAKQCFISIKYSTLFFTVISLNLTISGMVFFLYRKRSVQSPPNCWRRRQRYEATQYFFLCFYIARGHIC